MPTRLFALPAALLLLACQGPGSTPAKEPFQPLLGLRPLAVTLGPGATQAFQAEVNYPEGVRYLKQPVGWRVMEEGGGTIDGRGVYTAPAAPGTYRVQVRREDFPEVTAIALVTVK